MKSLSAPRSITLTFALLLAIAATVSCGQDAENANAPTERAASVEQASNLPKAPDFTLPAANKGIDITLSNFEGDRPVVLVFYRAYW